MTVHEGGPGRRHHGEHEHDDAVEQLRDRVAALAKRPPLHPSLSTPVLNGAL